MEDERYMKEGRRGVIGWIVRHPKTTVTLCLFLLFAVFVFGLEVTAKRGMERRIAAIRARGEPVTVADLAALRRTINDDGERIFAIARIAEETIKIKICEPTWGCVATDDPTKATPTGERIRGPCLKFCTECLDGCADERRRLHEAMKLQGNLIRLNWVSPAMNVVIPHLRGIRQAVRILSIEAGIAAEHGDSDAAGRAILDLCSLSPFCGPDCSVIVALTQMSAIVAVADRIERSINQCGLTAGVLLELQRRLAAVEASLDLNRCFLVERVFFIDMMTCLQAGAIPSAAVFGGPQYMGTMWRYMPGFRYMDSNAGLNAYAQIVDAIDGPTIESLNRLESIRASAPSNAWYAVYSRSLVPSLTRAVVLWLRSVGQLRAMQVAIAAERYRLANHRWPEAASELVPEFLRDVPIDPIDDRFIRFARIPEGIKSWTISSDESNADAMANIAKTFKATLGVSAKSLDALATLTEKIKALGVEDMVIDHGAGTAKEMLQNNTLIRRAAIKKNFKPLGYPVITFAQRDDSMLEALIATLGIAKYSSLVVLSKIEKWKNLALFTSRQNIYTDPQVPMQVEQKIYKIGEPSPESPLMITTNFSLTYFIVSGEVENSKVPCRLAVMDSEGLSVLTAWAAGKFTASKIAQFIQESGIENEVKNKELIIPGYVAILSGAIEDKLPGWKVTVGPREANAIPTFLKTRV